MNQFRCWPSSLWISKQTRIALVGHVLNISRLRAGQDGQRGECEAGGFHGDVCQEDKRMLLLYHILYSLHHTDVDTRASLPRRWYMLWSHNGEIWNP